ncbi:hypothetical protein ACW4FQ_26855, partial [Escherichia coli]
FPLRFPRNLSPIFANGGADFLFQFIFCSCAYQKGFYPIYWLPPKDTRPIPLDRVRALGPI